MSLNITFNPSTAGNKSGSIVIKHSGIGETATVTLSGQTGVSTASLYTINTGGTAITLEGKNWAADNYFTGGKIYTNNNIADISGTNSDALYKTERSSATPFGYAFPVANGTYRVNLHFAEIYWGATGGGAGGIGKRVFGVNIEGGATELPNFDIYAEAGAMKAIVKSFDVTVTDGQLNIDFSVNVNQPKISAIEITSPGTNPVADITSNPGSLHFFSQQAGTTSAAQTIILTNNASGSRQISNVTLSGANQAEFAHNFSGSVTLNAGQTKSISITFKPNELGTRVAQLNVSYAGSTSPLNIGLTGEGTTNPVQIQVTEFKLIDAGNEQDLQTLTEGATLNLADLSKNLNIRAVTNPPSVGSVKFILSGAQSRQQTETEAPYALFQDTNGNYHNWIPVIGSYTLVATPYSLSNGGGTAGTPLTIHFNVTNQVNVQSNPGGRLAGDNEPVGLFLNDRVRYKYESVTTIFPNPVSEKIFINVSDWKLSDPSA